MRRKDEATIGIYEEKVEKIGELLVGGGIGGALVFAEGRGTWLLHRVKERSSGHKGLS